MGILVYSLEDKITIEMIWTSADVTNFNLSKAEGSIILIEAEQSPKDIEK